MAVTISTNYILKTLWPQARVDNTVYPDHPFFAMVPKATDFFGENMYLAARYADSQGRSADFATAQAAAGAHTGVRFLLTRASDYQVCALTTEAILAAENDKGSLIANLDTELESGFNNISKSLAVSLFRGRSGQIGRLASDPGTGTTFTLLNINDVTSWEKGMAVVASGTLTGANRAGGSRTVSAVDRDTGVITVSAAIDAAWAASDYLFPAGDNANGSGNGNKVLGLADWLPTTAPVAGSDSFLGVDRGVDATRLAGLRIDASALNPEEGVVTALSKLGREGGRPDHFFMNHLDFRNVEMSLGSKVVYKQKSVGEIGFSGVEVISGTGKGVSTLYADQDCPSALGYALQMDSWKLYSLKGCPMIFDMDGNKLSRVYNADQWEARIGYFANLGCHKGPGRNGVVTLPS